MAQLRLARVDGWLAASATHRAQGVRPCRWIKNGMVYGLCANISSWPAGNLLNN
jgi:hypothetical protein